MRGHAGPAASSRERPATGKCCGTQGRKFETMKAGNADWEENGKAVQAKFDEISTCMSPDIMIAGSYIIILILN